MDPVNKRKYFRIETLLSVRWQILDEEETQLVKKGMGGTLLKGAGHPSPIDEFLEQVTPGSEEEHLYHCLQLINNKLDFIIGHILSKSTEDLSTQNDIIEISASGLKFATKETLQTGTFMKMNLIIPGTFQYQIDLIAEILRVEEKGKDFIVAARIVEIDEDARESIVKTVFEKQRRNIRSERIIKED